MKFRIGIATAMLALASPCFGVVVVSDPFTDGARTNGSDPLDVNWLEQNGSINSTVNATPQSNITGSGLFVDSEATFRAIVAQFPMQELVNVGDSLTLAFDFRVFSAGTTATSSTPAAQAAASELRFGLFNTDGTSPTADGATSSTDDFGYRNVIHVGNTAPAVGGFLSESGIAGGGDVLGGSDGTTISTTGTAFRISDTDAYSASLTISRTLAGVDLRMTVYDGIGLTGAVLGSSFATDTGAVNNTNSATGIYTRFDLIAFSSGAVDFNYRLDNISVSFEVIPEPTSLALLGLGVLGLSRRRRLA